MLNCCLDTSHGNTPRSHSQSHPLLLQPSPRIIFALPLNFLSFPNLSIGLASARLSHLERISYLPRNRTDSSTSPLSVQPRNRCGIFLLSAFCANFSPSTNHIEILQCVRSSYIRRIFSRLSPVTPVTRLAVIPPPIPHQL